MALAKNLFNKAKAWGLYEGENSATGVKFLEGPKRRLRYLEASEEAKLLDVSLEPLRSLITIGTNTGIRISAEALTLKRLDLDLSRNMLTVQAASSKNGQTRNIPLNSRAKSAFQHLRGISRSDHVCSNRTAFPISPLRSPF